MKRLSIGLLLIVGAAACSPQRDAPATDASRAPAQQPAQAPHADQPSEDVPPATAADLQQTRPDESGADTQARFDGYGDLKLGIDAQQMPAAWGGELKRLGGVEETCYFLVPGWAKTPTDLAFMVEGGKFVRYQTNADKMAAPGGGKVGMTVDELRALYTARLQESPHKYVEGAHYLRVDEGNGKSALLFETDAKGKVSGWRVGLDPQVGYVEGCS